MPQWLPVWLKSIYHTIHNKQDSPFLHIVSCIFCQLYSYLSFSDYDKIKCQSSHNFDFCNCLECWMFFEILAYFDLPFQNSLYRSIDHFKVSFLSSRPCNVFVYSGYQSHVHLCVHSIDCSFLLYRNFLLLWDLIGQLVAALILDQMELYLKSTFLLLNHEG